MTQNVDIKNCYVFTAIPDKIKKELAIVKFDVNEYLKEIDKYKKDRPSNQIYYDYDKELDFSVDTKEPESIKRKIYDERWYYYKAYHYLKLGLFLRKDAPPFKVSLSHLSPEIIYELNQLSEKDRKFVLKQAVGRLFEDINFDMYHNSISANLEVILII
jgi:hypothetical protein